MLRMLLLRLLLVDTGSLKQKLIIRNRSAWPNLFLLCVFPFSYFTSLDDECFSKYEYDICKAW